MSKRIGTVGIVALILFFVWEGYEYVRFRTDYAVSDAAFIKSDALAVLSFKVDGKVVQMVKKPNEAVRKGELLARIDPKDYLKEKEALLHQEKALQRRIDAAVLQRDRLHRTLQIKTALSNDDVKNAQQNIEALALRIKAMEANLRKLQRDERRYADLLKQRLIARERYENIHTRRIELQRQIDAMRKTFEANRSGVDKAKKAWRLAKIEQKRIAELEKSIEAMQEERKSLRARIAELSRRIEDTALYAPFDGTVAKKFFDAPRVVEAGYPVYAVVDPEALYCEVLLSEKKLHGVKPGNRVRITVDALEDKAFQGTVTSVAPVSASTFSLVPRDIASGEFTKLDQRFIVRISLEEKEGLRSGMGATVAIERK